MNRASRITHHDLSNPGRRLLSRRDFLQRAGNGLGGIALASLLAEHGLLAAENPLRPVIDPARPYAPREPVLAALHWLGGRFPRGERRTDIQMIPEPFVRATLAAAGMQVVRQARVSRGFYHVTLLEARRAAD